MAAKKDFTLNDFRKHFDQLDKMGDDLLPHMLGFPNEGDPKESLRRVRRMIDAMTEEERGDPDSIDLSHCQRIAGESGTTTEEVQQFLEQFKQVRKIMRKLGEMSAWQRIKLTFGFGRLNWDDEE